MSSWFEHVERSVDAVEGFVPHYVFVGDPRTDPGTFAEIDRLCLLYGRDRDVVEIEEEFRPYKRIWNTPRLRHMAHIRNVLLGHVRKLEPDVFWSLDSDILVAPGVFDSASAMLGEYDAVGTKCYMSSNRAAPSFAMLPSPARGLLRPDSEGQLKVDVIMASKLMSPAAYEIDYVVHPQGEDVGWSILARRSGLELGWDGTVCSKHVMEQRNLDTIDPRCGY